MQNEAIARRYDAAVESFVDRVRGDTNVIAVIVYGSVSHRTVWEKSDIDLEVVVRDQKLEHTMYTFYEDGIPVHAKLTMRSEVRRGLEKIFTGSMGHSFGTTSRIVYTTDESLHEYYEENKQVGQADVERTLFYRAASLLGIMEKVEKWLVVKKDVTYSRYHLIWAAEDIAIMEVCSHFQIPTREVFQQAARISPGLMERFYLRPMAGPMTEEEIRALLREMQIYIQSHMQAILAVVSEFFGDGEMKTGTHITTHFGVQIHYLHTMLDYLCEQGILIPIPQTIRITPRSKPAVEEVAFLMPPRD